ncbi:MAG: hypothetical protein AAGA55_03875 [Planctomycetota bacterium]
MIAGRFVSGIFGIVSFALAGCAGTAPPAGQAQLPSLEAIISAHDARVAALDTFWARTSIRVEGRDAAGSSFSEQGEGHLQAERPGSVAITVGKLGDVYIALGSNDDRYWLIDVSDSDRRLMMSGAQSEATPEKAAALGLPVHPRDIPLLLGLNPMGGRTVGEPEMDDRGRVVVGIESRWGTAELLFDPVSLELIGAAAFDDQGVSLAIAELSRHTDVANQVGQGRLGRVPGKAEIRVPGFDGFVRMELEDARVRTINPTVFDPDRLGRAYRVRERIDLDEPDPGRAG